MTKSEQTVLALVVPCFNEEKVLPVTARELSAKIDALVADKIISRDSRIYLVDDGSTDKTWQLICEHADRQPHFCGIKLTRNYGHQYAVYAGLMQAEGDILISIDADLQDDIDVIDEMIASYNAGSQIVYGVRHERTTDTRFKRWSAAFHYRVAALLGVQTVKNHADFRLMSRRAVDLLSEYRESNLYLRGVVPLLGLPSSEVYYKRQSRRGGESKYGLKEMFSLSIKGITSFSIMPLRIISILGMAVFVISFCLGGWALHAKLTGNTTAIDGWASTVIPIYLLGGLQLLAIGIAGEYIGKTYMQVKNRPLYQIEKTTDD